MKSLILLTILYERGFSTETTENGCFIRGKVFVACKGEKISIGIWKSPEERGEIDWTWSVVTVKEYTREHERPRDNRWQGSRT